ncbi:MAG: DUF4286 family protein [Polyangiales bacterium]
MIAYTVRCEIEDAGVAGEWVQWMRGEHLADVCAAGAIEATLVRLDLEAALTFEARYLFESAEAFERYEREHAPALRAEGLARFPLERGLRYSRSVGEVLARQQP